MRVTEIVRYAYNSLDALMLEQKDTPQMLLGSAWHYFILRNNRETKPSNVVRIDANDYRTKASREIRDEALANGKIPLLRKEYNSIVEMMETLKNDIDKIFPSDAEYELEVEGDVHQFGKVLGHIDCLTKDDVIDLKISANTANLDKHICDFGYYLQMVLYMRMSGRETAKLVFINPDSLLIHIKRLDLHSLQNMANVMLRVAYSKYQKLQNIMHDLENKKELRVNVSDFEIPQYELYKMVELETKIQRGEL